MTQPFLIEDVPALRLALPAGRAAHTAGKPSYRRIRSRGDCRSPCDDCVLILHEHGWVGPAPLPARWVRASPAGKLRLCHPHVQAWMLADKKDARA
jgi:hypothetical protein